jgi:ubiquitin C-terminal hydrolase
MVKRLVHHCQAHNSRLSLPDAQASYLEPEVLCGDNQYSCERCARKVDARRQVALRALPPYLCLSLQRFYFKPEVCRLATVAWWLLVLCFPRTIGATHHRTPGLAANMSADQFQSCRHVHDSL